MLANSEVPNIDNTSNDTPPATIGTVTVRKNRDEMF